VKRVVGCGVGSLDRSGVVRVVLREENKTKNYKKLN